nr:MAG TPA: hypothetical protein [Caudoviricetes sp.]
MEFPFCPWRAAHISDVPLLYDNVRTESRGRMHKVPRGITAQSL